MAFVSSNSTVKGMVLGAVPAYRGWCLAFAQGPATYRKSQFQTGPFHIIHRLSRHTHTASTTIRMPRIALLPGSARVNANNPGIQHFVASVLHGRADANAITPLDISLLDLQKPPMALGPMTSPLVPKAVRDIAKYPDGPTRAWARFIKDTDAFIFVTPQYNGTYPGALKNVVDQLFWEWSEKPVVIVAYGGGSHGKGAAEDLTRLLEGAFKMKVLGKVTVGMPITFIAGDERVRVPVDGEQEVPVWLEQHRPALEGAIDALLAAISEHQADIASVAKD